MTIAKEEKPLSLIMAKETYRKLLFDPDAQVQLLIQLIATSHEEGVMAPLHDFESVLRAVEERFLELKGGE